MRISICKHSGRDSRCDVYSSNIKQNYTNADDGSTAAEVAVAME